MVARRYVNATAVILLLLFLTSVASVSAAQETQPGQLTPQQPLDTTHKAKISLYGTWGIGFDKVDVGKTSQGDTVSISGSGGFGFGFGIGYGIARNFDLDIDLQSQISTLTPPVENAEGKFKRTIVLATMKFKIPVSSNNQVKLGAGIGQYLGGQLDVDTTNVAFGEHVVVDYKTATGFHFTGDFEHMIRQDLSVQVGGKFYRVKYEADSATRNNAAVPVSSLRDDVRNFKGSGFDFLVGISLYF